MGNKSKNNEFERRKQNNDNTFHIRLKQHEWDILERLSNKWQIGSVCGVLHRLISVADYLVDEQEKLLAEKEAMVKRFRV